MNEHWVAVGMGVGAGALLIIGHFLTRSVGELPPIPRYVIGVGTLLAGFAGWAGVTGDWDAWTALAIIALISGAAVRGVYAWHPLAARLQHAMHDPISEHLGGMK